MKIIKLFLSMLGAVAIFFCLVVGIDAQTSNNLKINYLDNFPGVVNFDSKYKEVDKYLVYKYVKFSFSQPVAIKSVNINFLVDNDWYQENKIKDVIFLKFDNNEWRRVNYSNKTVQGNYIKYEISSNSVGQYWAIIGVLPNENNYIGNIKNIKKINKDTVFFETVNKINNAEKIVNFSEDLIIKLKEPVTVKGTTAITTTTATISLITLLALLGGPVNFLIIFQQLGIAFFSLFFSKNKHRSGIVYDVNTGKPISLARVNLVDQKTGRIKTTKFTDKKGRYYFLAPEGDYRLEVQKKGYLIINKTKHHLFKALWHKNDLMPDMKLDKPGIIKKNIAVLRDESSLLEGTFKNIIKNTFKYLARVLFFLGVIFSLWSCYANPTVFNFFILGIYFLIIIIVSFFTQKIKYGTIVNKNGEPEPFANISILDAKTKKQIARSITDTKGRYYLLLEKGSYILKVQTSGGVTVSQNIKVKNSTVLSKKIVVNGLT